MQRLAVATTNRGKLHEIEQLLVGVPFELVTLTRWPDVAAPEETGKTFAENARAKALYYAARTGELTVAEDSGLEIDALDGEPGVESARFGGPRATYPEKFALIYDALHAKGVDGSPARFVCALALARGGRILFETRGQVEGRHCAKAEGDRRVRLRPDLFLSAVWLHAGRSRRPQGRGEPSWRGLPRAAHVSEHDVQRGARRERGVIVGRARRYTVVAQGFSPARLVRQA